MHTVTLQEAKERLAELVEEAMQGGEVMILKGAKPAVKLVAVPNGEAAPPAEDWPLRGTVLRYDDPTEPVAETDWESAR